MHGDHAHTYTHTHTHKTRTYTHAQLLTCTQAPMLNCVQVREAQAAYDQAAEQGHSALNKVRHATPHCC